MTQWVPYAGRLKTHRMPGGGYSVHLDGEKIGDLVKTGTHLDDYPWDWSCEDGKCLPDRPIRGGMVTDTKKAAIGEIAYHCGWNFQEATWSK